MVVNTVCPWFPILGGWSMTSCCCSIPSLPIPGITEYAYSFEGDCFQASDSAPSCLPQALGSLCICLRVDQGCVFAVLPSSVASLE